MIRKIKGKYFVDSVKELVIVERKLEKPLPVEIQDNSMLLREPICCICGGGERKDVAIALVKGDRTKRICSSCVEQHMPELWPELKKRIYERNLELGITEMAEEVKKNSPF